MKKVLTALVLATTISAPALARTTPHDHIGAMSLTRAPRAQFDMLGSRTLGLRGNDVVVNGQFAGRDPDPNIRFELSREFGTNR